MIPPNDININKQNISLITPQYERAHINAQSNYESYQNYMKSKKFLNYLKRNFY